jgi:hypothetical protein
VDANHSVSARETFWRPVLSMLRGDSRVDTPPAGSDLERPVAANAPKAAVDRRNALRDTITISQSGWCRTRRPAVEAAVVYHGSRSIPSMTVRESIPLTPS